MKYDSVTTIKVNKELYNSFKIENIRTKLTLQDFVNKAMYLYINDADFKDKIYNFILPVLSPESQETILQVTGSSNYDN